MKWFSYGTRYRVASTFFCPLRSSFNYIFIRISQSIAQHLGSAVRPSLSRSRLEALMDELSGKKRFRMCLHGKQEIFPEQTRKLSWLLFKVERKEIKLHKTIPPLYSKQTISLSQFSSFFFALLN